MFYVVGEIKPSRRKWGYFIYDTDDKSVEFVSTTDFKRLVRKGYDFYSEDENFSLGNALYPSSCMKLCVLAGERSYTDLIFAEIKFKDDWDIVHTGYLGLCKRRTAGSRSLGLNIMLNYTVSHKPHYGFKFAEAGTGFYDRRFQVFTWMFSPPMLFVYNLFANKDGYLLQPFFTSEVEFTWFEGFISLDSVIAGIV